MNKPFSCFGVHGHYTHECPLLPQMHQMWETQVASRGQQSPQNLVPPHPVMLTNPFPQQGFVAAQPQLGQATHLPQPSSLSDYQILMMNFDEVNPSNINLQTLSHPYDKPSTSLVVESKTKVSTEPLMTRNGPL